MADSADAGDHPPPPTPPPDHPHPGAATSPISQAASMASAEQNGGQESGMDKLENDAIVAVANPEVANPTAASAEINQLTPVKETEAETEAETETETARATNGADLAISAKTTTTSSRTSTTTTTTTTVEDALQPTSVQAQPWSSKPLQGSRDVVSSTASNTSPAADRGSMDAGVEPQQQQPEEVASQVCAVATISAPIVVENAAPAAETTAQGMNSQSTAKAQNADAAIPSPNSAAFAGGALQPRALVSAPSRKDEGYQDKSASPSTSSATATTGVMRSATAPHAPLQSASSSSQVSRASEVKKDGSSSTSSNHQRSSPLPGGPASPAGQSATSEEEEGMIREDDDDDEPGAIPDVNDDDARSRSRYSPQPGSSSSRYGGMQSSGIGQPPRRWGYPSDHRTSSAGSSYTPTRDATRSDSYHPGARSDRNRDWERERDWDRERDRAAGPSTVSRFPMTRSTDEPIARGSRGGDSYRPSSTPRPSVGYRTSSTGSMNEERERERERERSNRPWDTRDATQPPLSPTSERSRDEKDKRFDRRDVSETPSTPLSATYPSGQRLPPTAGGSAIRDAEADRWNPQTANGPRPWGSASASGSQGGNNRWNRWSTPRDGDGRNQWDTEEAARRDGRRENDVPETPLAARLQPLDGSITRGRGGMIPETPQAPLDDKAAIQGTSPRGSRSPASQRQLRRNTSPEASRGRSASPIQTLRSQRPVAPPTSFEPPPSDAGWSSRGAKGEDAEVPSAPEPLPSMPAPAIESREPQISKDVVEEGALPEDSEGLVKAEENVDEAIADVKPPVTSEKETEIKEAPTSASIASDVEMTIAGEHTIATAALPDVVPDAPSSKAALDEVVPASESAAPTLPAEAQIQDSVQGAGSTGAGLSTPTVQALSAAELDTENVPPRPLEMTVAEQPIIAPAEAMDIEAAIAVDADVSVDDAAVRNAVAVAEAVTAEVAAPSLEISAPPTDEEEQEESPEGEESPPTKTQEELELQRMATIRRLLSAKAINTDEVIDKMVQKNKRAADPVTSATLESAVYGPPFPAQTEPFDIYVTDENHERMRFLLTDQVIARKKRLLAKVIKMQDQYRALNKAWLANCAELDEAAEAREKARKAALQPSTPGGPGSGGQPNQDDPVANGLNTATPSMTGRANRRGGGIQSAFGFGDAVRSEAEFQEILASLESEGMQDPEQRAARTATTVPDQLINPEGDEPLKNQIDDSNGYVADPIGFYLDEFDPDYWSPEEKVIFARKYAIWPKQFGKIASALPHKTASQCVYYYYLTKHRIGHDYKAITAARNRNSKRKGGIKPKKAKGSALMADLKSAKGDETPVEAEDPGSPLDSSSRMRGMSMNDGAMVASIEEEGDAAGSRVLEEGAVSLDSPFGEKRTGKGSGRGGKRVKGSGKGKNVNVPEQTSSPIPEPATAISTPKEEVASEMDFAAAEALGSLAGQSSVIATDATSASKAKKRKAGSIAPGDERKPKQATSSYWSIQERAEFLRSLIIHGKDWSAVSANLGAKSAAQARNYFARNVDVAEYRDAAELGEQNATQVLQIREDLAVSFVKDRLGITYDPVKGYAGLANVSGVSGANTPNSAIAGARSKSGSSRPSKEPSPESAPRRAGGMGIMSLLNEDSSSSSDGGAARIKKPFLQDWFGGADDETETDVPKEKKYASSAFFQKHVDSSSSSDRVFLSTENEDSTDSEDPLYQQRVREQQRMQAAAQPRPYLPDARAISAAPSGPPAPPKAPSVSVHPPAYDRSAGPPPLSGSWYGESQRYSHSPVYDSRTGPMREQEGGYQRTERPVSPVYERSSSVQRHLQPSAAYDRSGMSMPPPSGLTPLSTPGQRHGSWSSASPTSSLREGSIEYSQARPSSASLSQQARYNAPPLQSTASSRSLGGSSFPSPGPAGSAPGGRESSYHVSAGSHPPARPYESDMRVSAPPGSGPSRPLSSGGPPTSTSSLRSSASPYPLPPRLPSPGAVGPHVSSHRASPAPYSHYQHPGYDGRSPSSQPHSSISAAPLGPPPPPKLSSPRGVHDSLPPGSRSPNVQPGRLPPPPLHSQGRDARERSLPSLPPLGGGHGHGRGSMPPPPDRGSGSGSGSNSGHHDGHGHGHGRW